MPKAANGPGQVDEPSLREVLQEIRNLSAKVDDNMELGKEIATALAQIVMTTAAELKDSTVDIAADLKENTMIIAADLKQVTLETAADVKKTAEENAALLAQADSGTTNYRQSTAVITEGMKRTVRSATELVRTVSERNAMLTPLLVQSLDVVSISVNELSETANNLADRSTHEEFLLQKRTKYFVTITFLLVTILGVLMYMLFTR